MPGSRFSFRHHIRKGEETEFTPLSLPSRLRGERTDRADGADSVLTKCREALDHPNRGGFGAGSPQAPAARFMFAAPLGRQALASSDPELAARSAGI